MRRLTCLRALLSPAIALGGLLLLAEAAQGGSFQLSEAIRTAMPNAVSHPLGYNGTGGNLTVSVCVEPTSPFATNLPAPLQKAILTLNNLTPTIGTYVPPGTSTQVPANQWDAESALLHEVGHCIGINHTNLATVLPEPLPTFFGDASYSTEGPDMDFTFTFIGGDNIWGSKDDDRGDDVNLVWFRKSSNDPFLIDPLPAPAVDSLTYSRNLADLPAMHDYAANGTPSVAGSLGYPSTRAVMYAQIGPQSEFRSLANDDVAMLKYGMSGLDEIAGTADDYTFTVEFTNHPCDIPVRFVPLGTSPVSRCGVNYNLIAGSTDHYEVDPVFIELNSDFAFFFGFSPDLQIAKDDGGVVAIPGEDLSYTISVANTGTADSTGVEIEETVPDNTMFNAAASDPAWACAAPTPGSQCALPVGTLTAGGPGTNVLFVVTVDDPLPPGANQIVNVATVSDDGASGPDADPANNMVQTSTPTTASMVFADGFESGDTSAWSDTVP